MRNALRLIVINGVVLAVLAELAALAWHFAMHDEFYYTRKRPAAGVTMAATAPLTTFRVAPYFGFMRAPGLALKDVITAERLAQLAAPAKSPDWIAVTTNNYGFLSTHDFPLSVTSGKPFVIGIFGGSVAQWFALQGATPLGRDLRAAAALRDRDIVILNFAAGGYKQPQQLLVLNYFLVLGQHFDFVINIDGFNEIALARHNLAAGVAASMPSVEHMTPLAQLAPLEQGGAGGALVAQLADLKRQMAQLEAAAEQAPLALGNLVDTLRLRRFAREYADLTATMGAASSEATPSLIELVASTPTVGAAADTEVAVKLWSTASRQMHDLLQMRGIPYLHVVQPNQYFGNHLFAPAEARLAVREDSPYRPHVLAGYPALLAALPALRTAGVDVLDATRLFDGDSAPVYADDCCHYNQRGNDQFARAIATAMIMSLQRTPRPAAIAPR
ncbi:MAG: hypothetical protein ABI777_06920 [Betaproteobacteria bacterium]